MNNLSNSLISILDTKIGFYISLFFTLAVASLIFFRVLISGWYDCKNCPLLFRHKISFTFDFFGIRAKII